MQICSCIIVSMEWGFPSSLLFTYFGNTNRSRVEMQEWCCQLILVIVHRETVWQFKLYCLNKQTAKLNLISVSLNAQTHSFKECLLSATRSQTQSQTSRRLQLDNKNGQIDHCMQFDEGCDKVWVPWRVRRHFIEKSVLKLNKERTSLERHSLLKNFQKFHQRRTCSLAIAAGGNLEELTYYDKRTECCPH